LSFNDLGYCFQGNLSVEHGHNLGMHLAPSMSYFVKL
jgi:hypothetical protein